MLSIFLFIKKTVHSKALCYKVALL